MHIRHHVFLLVTMLLLWILLTGSLAMEELMAGLAVAIVVSLVSAPYISILDGLRYHPMALISVAGYLGYFFIALIRANLDLARRVLDPALPIDPLIVETETELTSELGRILLANSITLTPGTLSVDMQDNRILVHWVAPPEGQDLQQATRDITTGFEKHIGGFLS